MIRIIAIITLYLICNTHCQNIDTCKSYDKYVNWVGTTNNLNGWVPTTWETFPFVVSINVQRKDGQSFRCTGSILYKGECGVGVILTAAHCVNSTTSIEVWIGCTNRPCSEDLNAVLYRSHYYTVHQFYDSKSSVSRNDMGLIFLDCPITKPSNAVAIKTINPTDPSHFQGDPWTYVTIVSYGGKCSQQRIDAGECKGGSDNTRLEYAYFDIVSSSECSKAHPSEQHLIGQFDICLHDNFAGDGNQSVCRGDSGAPILYEEICGETPIQVGIEAWGPVDCNPKDPNVAPFIPFYHAYLHNMMEYWCHGNNFTFDFTQYQCPIHKLVKGVWQCPAGNTNGMGNEKDITIIINNFNNIYNGDDNEDNKSIFHGSASGNNPGGNNNGPINGQPCICASKGGINPGGNNAGGNNPGGNNPGGNNPGGNNPGGNNPGGNNPGGNNPGGNNPGGNNPGGNNGEDDDDNGCVCVCTNNPGGNNPGGNNPGGNNPGGNNPGGNNPGGNNPRGLIGFYTGNWFYDDNSAYPGFNDKLLSFVGGSKEFYEYISKFEGCINEPQSNHEKKQFVTIPSGVMGSVLTLNKMTKPMGIMGSYNQICGVNALYNNKCDAAGKLVNDIKGYMDCINDYDCCLCGGVQCGDVNHGCNVFNAGNSGIYGVKNVNIIGALDTGAVINCGGIEGCAESAIKASNIQSLNADASMSLRNAVVSIQNPKAGFSLNCLGLASCDGLFLEIIYSKPSIGYMCNADVHYNLDISAIKCFGTGSCRNMELIIKNEGCGTVEIQAIECIQSGACENSSINIIGDVDVNYCHFTENPPLGYEFSAFCKNLLV